MRTFKLSLPQYSYSMPLSSAGSLPCESCVGAGDMFFVLLSVALALYMREVWSKDAWF